MIMQIERELEKKVWLETISLHRIYIQWGGECDILNNINPIFENVDSSDHKDIFESALVARKRLIILHFQN